MVVSNPSWVRPAQALIYTASGEALPFPPLSCGVLPRALTFSDWPGPEKSEQLSQIIHKTDEAEDNACSYCSEPKDQFSFLVTSNTSKDEIEDPPEAYESFEVDCTQQPISKNAEEIYMEYGVPYMSTPTECYSNKLRQQEYQLLPPRRSSPLPSGSESCPSSPLIQTGTTAYLSLDELVDLYTKRMEAARKAQELNDKIDDLLEEKTASFVGQFNIELSLPESHQIRSCPTLYEGSNSEDQRICTKGIHSISAEMETSSSSPTTSLQLMTLDIQELIRRLDDLFDDENSRDEDMLFISVDELESLLMSCRRNSPECGSR